MKNVVVCYLGTKGAGARMFLDLARFVRDSKLEEQFSFVCIGKSEFRDELKGLRALFLPLGGRIIRSLIFLLRYPRIKRNLSTLLKNSSISRAFFVMPSPPDWILNRIFRRLDLEIVHTIHDGKKHPGEFWPWKRSISWRIHTSKFVLCYSTYVAQQCVNFSAKVEIRVINHPYFFPTLECNQNVFSIPEEYALFIGRNRTYKGLSRLIKCYLEVKPKLPLLVAGQSMTEALHLEKQGIFVINRWLTDAEYDSLIRSSKVVILPYTEASQSGIISTAMQFRKPLIASRVGGIIEQVGDYEKVCWISPTDDSSLKISLSKLGDMIRHNDFGSDSFSLAASTYRNLLENIQK